MSAATQRWETGVLSRWYATFDHFMRVFAYEAPVRVEITDTGVADSLNTVKHLLGRIPKGVLIINNVVPLPGASATWYRLSTDAEWTDSEITLRFDVDNARVLLEVF